MEEKNVKTGFWSEYFRSLGNHPFRTVVATAIVVDGITCIVSYIFSKSKPNDE